MIVRRLETHHEPSVRFYRTIALSFLAFTVVLLGAVIFLSARKTTIVVYAKNDNQTIAPKITLTGADGLIDLEKKNFYWRAVFSPVGVKVSDAVAQGEVIIYNKTEVDYVLVKTTRLLTSAGVLFRLSDRTTIPANGQIGAKVYADQSGPASEIGPAQFSIPGLSIDKQKFIYAESKETMKGGVRRVGVITESDLAAARENFSVQAKQAFIEQLAAPTGTVVAVLMQDAPAASDLPVGTETDNFYLSGTTTMIFMRYIDAVFQEKFNAELAKITAEAEKLVAVNSQPAVEISAYDLDRQTAELSARASVVTTVNPEAPAFSWQNFAGKKKDAIERYILGQDHVSGVEVKFSPPWMMSAPAVPDRIQVIVKNIK